MNNKNKKTKSNVLPLFALLLLSVLISAVTAQAGTLAVNWIGDINGCDGQLSLREAMLIARGGNSLGRPLTNGERNQISGATFVSAPPPVGCSFTASYWSITSGVGSNIPDNIVFEDDVNAIFLQSGLPNITWAEDIINGLRSNGLKTAIDGTNAGSVPGLRVTGTIGFKIRNLIIRNFQYEGILLENSENGVFEGLEIYGNGRDGIALMPFTYLDGDYNSINNRIGGPDASQRNFIYSNAHNGISIISSPSAQTSPDMNNVIENNYIGLKDSNGNADFGNGWEGIYLRGAFGNRIGGDTAGSRNVISGNDRNGIWMHGYNSFSNRIFNNFIGTNKDGNAVIGNTHSGIALSENAGWRGGQIVPPNIIGDVGKGNVIGGNFYGIALYDPYTSGNVIRGNFIGTDLTASFNLGNIYGGIAMGNETHDNIIGGGANGEGNTIAYNNNPGIFIDNGYNNSIRRNNIFLNATLGIDLGTNGVTLNDFNDTDAGANNFQNYPLISGGSSGGGFTNVSGSINSTANTVLTLDFFVSLNRDPSGYGEGATYIGSTQVTTNNVGDAGFNSSFNTIINYQGFYATATATDPNGNTSEFSPALRIGCNYTLSSSSQNFSVAGGNGSFNVNTLGTCDWQAIRSADWITITGGASGTGNGTVSFSVAANSGPARTGTITVGGRIFTITQASNCSYSLSHPQASYPSGGTNFDGVTVIAPNGCTWTATSNVAWVTITAGSSGNGNGNVSWSVAANTGPARQTTLSVAGLTFTINQASGCTYSLLDPGANTFEYTGGNGGNFVFASASACNWTAQSDSAWVTITSGPGGTGSGQVTYTVAPNPGGVRTAFLNLAGRIYTIYQGPAPRRAPFDFDGDDKTDISIYRPSVGEWWYLKSSNGGNAAFQFGNSTDKIMPKDFTGDGKTDIAFWRPSDGFWFVLRSEDYSFYAFPFGQNGDIPAPGDFDGDAKADVAVFRPSTVTWYIFRSSGGTSIITFGAGTDIPVIEDYDGDGIADIAIFRPSGPNGAEWWIRRSINNSVYAFVFGVSTDKPVQGDYTGDGKADVAVWRPSDRNWYILRSENSSYYSFPFGASTDIPAPGDYDGDGKYDAALYRPSETYWYLLRSTAGFTALQFGLSTDQPVPAAFVP